MVVGAHRFREHAHGAPGLARLRQHLGLGLQQARDAPGRSEIGHEGVDEEGIARRCIDLDEETGPGHGLVGQGDRRSSVTHGPAAHDRVVAIVQPQQHALRQGVTSGSSPFVQRSGVAFRRDRPDVLEARGRPALEAMQLSLLGQACPHPAERSPDEVEHNGQGDHEDEKDDEKQRGLSHGLPSGVDDCARSAMFVASLPRREPARLPPGSMRWRNEPSRAWYSQSSAAI